MFATFAHGTSLDGRTVSTAIVRLKRRYAVDFKRLAA